MVYKVIPWWRDPVTGTACAYHVFEGDKRLGIVNKRMVRFNGEDQGPAWFAHNYNFFSIKGQFGSRTEAAEAIPKGKIHQTVEAFS